MDALLSLGVGGWVAGKTSIHLSPLLSSTYPWGGASEPELEDGAGKVFLLFAGELCLEVEVGG